MGGSIYDVDRARFKVSASNELCLRTVEEPLLKTRQDARTQEEGCGPSRTGEEKP